MQDRHFREDPLRIHPQISPITQIPRIPDYLLFAVCYLLFAISGSSDLRSFDLVSLLTIMFPFSCLMPPLTLRDSATSDLHLMVIRCDISAEDSKSKDLTPPPYTTS
jgi:hypothetical protein